MANPNERPASVQDPYASHLEQLIGFTVKQVIIYQDADAAEENVYGLLFSRTDAAGTEHFLYTEILRDEEGNGPGHLHVSKDLA